MTPTDTRDTVSLLPAAGFGKDFIPKEYLPAGADEYTLRNAQAARPAAGWRPLRADEVERLVKNNNRADRWDELLVTDPFEPGQIQNSRFHGLVRLGAVRNVVLQHHDLRLPAGITNSLVVSCDIGDDAAVHNVRSIAHYIVGSRCILFNIDEMHTTDHAKFGNGILKQGEPEPVRVWLDLMNETGCRRVLPFDGMLPADAYLWAKYRDDAALQRRLKEMTQAAFDDRRGHYGTVGDQAVIKNCLIVKDVKVGPHAYIKGANKLKNLTVRSSADEPTQIGEGVELVNGIVGDGCHIFYGCKAVRFVMGVHSNLKYGARLINSFLGDNSTVSCCEVLNNLIFPAHEQHHNNSFLIASLVMGQSNMAAGATVGSNHNSRANDNEVQAGRGFWPGLCSSVKHSSRFASFTLLSKADYPAELDIRLPFSLLNNDPAKDRLEVMPAYWWLYNMYALARNAWKTRDRDRRKNKAQHIEFDALAPDTAEEMRFGRRLLEIWTAKADRARRKEPAAGTGEDALAAEGRALLQGPAEKVDGLEVRGEGMEKSSRAVVILKTRAAHRAYGDMLHLYAVRQIAAYLDADPARTFASAARDLGGAPERAWVNLGGQLVPEPEVDRLRADIGSGALMAWEDVHGRYDALWERYPLEKQKHGWAVLCESLGTDRPDAAAWRAALDRATAIQRFVAEQVTVSRKKDFDNPFRRATFRNEAEMKAALGTVEENPFVQQVRREADAFASAAEELKKRA